MGKTTCRRCGGSVNKLAQTCVDCGGRTLRLRTVPNGRAVLVTGPGAIADKLDGASHAALVRLLDELPAHEASFPELRKQPPRLPFFVAEDLDDAAPVSWPPGWATSVSRRASNRARRCGPGSCAPRSIAWASGTPWSRLGSCRWR